MVFDLAGCSNPTERVGASAALAIRGRNLSPGMGTGTTTDDGQVDGCMPAIRGPASGPGASEAAPLSRAQMRLDEKNYHLRRSLGDHADRVARKKMECRHDNGAPSAADRIAAIRQRILQRAERAESSVRADLGQAMTVDHVDQGGGGGGDAERSRYTIEVSKIHLEDLGEDAITATEGGARAAATEASKAVAARRGREEDASVNLGLG